MILPAPAKLNLFLHITGQRPDGYHELQTAFQFIDLCDELTFELITDSNAISYEGPKFDDNIVIKVAKVLQLHTGIQMGAHIKLTKHIPTCAGLGGGSSDAATTLIALNHLWNGGLCAQELIDLGVKLGADVPIFLYGHAAIV